MSLDDVKPRKDWLLWTYDPCPEGGFHIAGEFDTREEAEAAAKALHEEKEKSFQGMVERMKKRGINWERSNGCYGGSLVTPGAVSSIQWGTP